MMEQIAIGMSDFCEGGDYSTVPKQQQTVHVTFLQTLILFDI